jgi:hypothetical protein
LGYIIIWEIEVNKNNQKVVNEKIYFVIFFILFILFYFRFFCWAEIMCNKWQCYQNLQNIFFTFCKEIMRVFWRMLLDVGENYVLHIFYNSRITWSYKLLQINATINFYRTPSTWDIKGQLTKPLIISWHQISILYQYKRACRFQTSWQYFFWITKGK